MAEDAARVALPRLRAAWLREMGVEVLWPTDTRSLRSPASGAEPQDAQVPGTDGSPDPVAVPATVVATRSPQATRNALPVLHDMPSRIEDASPAEGRVVALSENPAMLACRLYIAEASSGVQWMVVSDAVELHASREGPARFLDALIHAVMPGAKASILSIPVRDEQAVGWLAGDEALASLATDGLRLILIGTTARRAAGMPTRLGEIGRLQAGPVSLPAVALPLLNDLTASPTGKADAWRVLRALDSSSGS